MIIIKTSSDKLNILKSISKKLVEKKLAGCINLLPQCLSFFYWNDKVQENKEYLMLIKTTQDKEKKIYKLIYSKHNYDIPEILTINVASADKKYLHWMKNTLENK